MNKSIVVPIQSEPPTSIFFNRPSIEYTGFGNDIVFDAWSGRYFYSCEDAVRRGCEHVIDLYKGDSYSDGQEVNYNDLYLAWNIETSDFGSINRWNPVRDDGRVPNFVYSWCGPGTSLYDKFNERVLLVEPDIESFPEYCRNFMED